MSRADLVVLRPEGLYCPPGDFFIDPWRSVPRALITHAHADHARGGHGQILASQRSLGLLRVRLGPSQAMQGLAWGERLTINGVAVSFHPASHVLGAAQIRLEHRGDVWVVSGDYRVETDVSCDAFESVPCRVFITESTFGLPVYRWAPQAEVVAQINDWWGSNAASGRPSLLLAYSLGKAQRILASVSRDIGPIIVHPSVESLNEVYRAEGIDLPATRLVSELDRLADIDGALVLAPPNVMGSSWQRRFARGELAMASGWMQLRGRRRREALDRGFVLSDHADWPGLMQAIAATGAERVIVTHGQVAVMVRWLQEQGLQAGAFATEYGAEEA
jgi:putative mRNA 3-end processing factor